MRLRGLLKLNVLIAATVLPATAFSQTWTDFQVGGLTRRALVYVPSGIDNPPLLISLHGMGIGAGWNQAGMMKFEPIADREKFIVVYPEADQDLRWDLGGTHDIDFMVAIIEEMSRRHSIDVNRVYASGFSMGGMFSYTLACKIPDKIAAIAPGNGYPLGGESGCVRTRSVPIFHMHGTADDFVAYSGIHNFLNTKVSAYGCPATAVRTEPYPASNPTSKSFKEYWGPCTDSNGQTSEIILISVTGMIHDWATAGKANTNEDPEFAGKPFDIDGSEEAWAFLKNHSLTGASSGGTGGSGGADPGGTGGVATGGTGGTSSCVGEAQHAYLGAPSQVPGTVEAEDFDPAGYSDTTSGNEGGAYRVDEDVDIKEMGGGYALGWMNAGEWLEYTVNAAVEGDYRLVFKAGAVDAGRTLDVSACGVPLATVDVPQIAAWGELGSVTASPIHLTAGLQVIRISVGASDYLDLDAVAFELIGGGAGGSGGTGGAGVTGGAGGVATSCTLDTDCNDSDPCTADACDPIAGTCSHAPVSGCCQTPASCSSASACLQASCDVAVNQCALTPIAGCCATALDCDDGNACTTEACDATTGVCSVQPITGCCRLDGDCADENVCTTDSCDPITHACVNSAISACVPGGTSGGPATTEDGAVESGCGCRVGAAAPSWSGAFPLLALLVGAGIRRRLRRPTADMSRRHAPSTAARGGR